MELKNYYATRYKISVLKIPLTPHSPELDLGLLMSVNDWNTGSYVLF
jgi:hypothetical protein